jgi:hypothetical protein
MSAPKHIASGLVKIILSVTRIKYSSVLKPFGTIAGRELQKGNGGAMRNYNKLNRRIKK